MAAHYRTGGQITSPPVMEPDDKKADSVRVLGLPVDFKTIKNMLNQYKFWFNKIYIKSIFIFNLLY